MTFLRQTRLFVLMSTEKLECEKTLKTYHNSPAYTAYNAAINKAVVGNLEEESSSKKGGIPKNSLNESEGLNTYLPHCTKDLTVALEPDNDIIEKNSCLSPARNDTASIPLTCELISSEDVINPVSSHRQSQARSSTLALSGSDKNHRNRY
ncbi:unnamed protein product [Arctia plantaginis]|uniref:Uncharacterized protein n=1 Tax=Arctia plantaginis TaxID=874455 RepID=A0A8S0YR49_ARCPL|nr:unnamed protein product [Arctia plantaginis]